MVTDKAIQTDLLCEAVAEELEASKTELNVLRCNFETTKAELEVSVKYLHVTLMLNRLKVCKHHYFIP